MVYGHQIIITWHVNYLKVLHRDPVQIIKFALYTSSIYGEKLIVYRRKVHDYLGMDLYFSEKVTVKVSIIKYLNKILA